MGYNIKLGRILFDLSLFFLNHSLMSATPPNETSLPPLTTAALDTKHAVSEITPPPSEHGDSAPSTESSAKQEHHVRWAPMKIPLERRLQMLAMLMYVSLLFICLSAFLYSLLIPLLWPVVVAYLTFVYLDKAPEQGGRRFEWTRKLTFWKYFAGYYPISLVKVKRKLKALKARPELFSFRWG